MTPREQFLAEAAKRILINDGGFGTEIQALCFQTAASKDYMGRFRRDGESVSKLLSERDAAFGDDAAGWQVRLQGPGHLLRPLVGQLRRGGQARLVGAGLDRQILPIRNQLAAQHAFRRCGVADYLVGRRQFDLFHDGLPSCDPSTPRV